MWLVHLTGDDLSQLPLPQLSHQPLHSALAAGLAEEPLSGGKGAHVGDELEQRDLAVAREGDTEPESWDARVAIFVIKTGWKQAEWNNNGSKNVHIANGCYRANMQPCRSVFKLCNAFHPYKECSKLLAVTYFKGHNT